MSHQQFGGAPWWPV